MKEFPFSLSIKPFAPESRPEIVVCTDPLRVLAGKRQVLDALWGERPVVVKVFAEPLKAKRHMKRDWQGLKCLEKLGLNAPNALFCGKTDDGRYAVVTEKITDAATLSEIWNNTTDSIKKLGLLLMVSRELANQHLKGLLQKDLHLGNFLLKGQKLFTLDPAQIRFFSGQVKKKHALAQLAVLASNVPDEDTDAITRLCREYAQARSWKFSRLDLAALQKQLAACRKYNVKRALKKCMRTGKKFVRIRQPAHLGVALRDFYQKADFRKFIQDIDTLMQTGEILKKGNTCFVSHFTWAGREIVAKRYNYKGFFHSVRHTIKKTRARHAWLHAHRLGNLNIPTPKPIAYIEQRKAGLVYQSYIVTEYVHGQRLYDFLRADNLPEQSRSKAARQLKELFDKLGKYRITHGDLKYTNILITENGPILTDLDSMKVHSFNATYHKKRAKDLARLAKDLPLPPAIRNLCEKIRR